MADTSLLVWGVIFSSLGFGFFLYGKKQRAAVPLFSGIALFIVPYLISNVYLLVVTGIVLIALPYFLKL